MHLKIGIDLLVFHSPSFSAINSVHAGKCQKPSCILNKTKQRDERIARLFDLQARRPKTVGAVSSKFPTD